MKKSVLIIEDEEFVQSRLKSAFEEKKVQVHQAYDGKSGLEALKNIKPSLILLDIVMPHMDGISLLKKIHRRKSLRSIPVVVMTNLENEKDLEAIHEFGVKNILIKAHVDIPDIAEATIDQLNLHHA